MARNTNFHPEKEPFRQDDTLQLQDSKTTGPVRFLNPTEAQFVPAIDAKTVPTSGSGSGSDVENTPYSTTNKTTAQHPNQNSSPAPTGIFYRWTSRANRKGRHPLVVPASSTAQPETQTAPNSNTTTPASASQTAVLPPSSTSARAITKNLIRMAIYYPIWDVSYLVATTFTLGSVIWVINAFFVFLPSIQGHETFHDEQLSAGGISAFIGATVFVVGSVLLMLEAWNENRAGCFGWALEQELGWSEGNENEDEAGEKANGPKMVVRPDSDGCVHHHPRRGWLGRIGRRKGRKQGEQHVAKNTEKGDGSDSDNSRLDPSKPNNQTQDTRSWQWLPSYHDLTTHYIHDLGFLACSVQMAAATIFWISGFTALPGIYQYMSPGLTDGIYWTPQVVGGSGFIISGALFMLETQKKWYLPAYDVLGWHIGWLNMVGGWGFTLSPIFGYIPQHWAQYQAGCSTFWGSWAFLLGSVVQWYESLDKFPVEVKKD